MKSIFTVQRKVAGESFSREGSCWLLLYPPLTSPSFSENSTTTVSGQSEHETPTEFTDSHTTGATTTKLPFTPRETCRLAGCFALFSHFILH
jgi:hypothetical protein